MSESTENNTETLVKVAQAAVAAKARTVDVSGVPCNVAHDGRVEPMIDLVTMIDERAPKPRRRTGNANLMELDSFIAHVNRYKEKATTIWASAERALFVAVYNDHDIGDKADAAGWRDFRATYNCPLSPEWKFWRENADKAMSQEAFAELLDSRMEDLATGSAEGTPTAIEMLEMARNLQIHTKGTFAKKIDPTTGQYSMECKDEHTKDSTKIPRSFWAALRVFDGGSKYLVEMRLQFRLREGRPVFAYTMHRATELQADAFGEMRERVAKETDRAVFAGLAG